MKLKTAGIILVWLASVGFACAGTNDITTLVQKGLFEEEANHHLDAATEYYQEAIGKFDNDRQLTATAIFHLGECYRLQGKTNEANVQYQRIVREFSDQAQLVDLSRGYLPKTAGHSSFTQNLAKLPNGYPGDPVVANGGANTGSFVVDANGNLTRATGGPRSAGPTLADGSESFEERGEIRNIKDMIQNSPDLINTPGRLATVVRNGWMSAAKLLLENGVDVNPVMPTSFTAEMRPAAWTPLTAAADSGSKGMIELLLSKGASINALDAWHGFAPLHYAIEHGFKTVAETLLTHGANVNVSALDGDRPLHIAVDKGYINLVELLLAHKADVNAPGKDGETAIFRAIQNNNADMVQFLVSNKANVNIKAESGETPLLAAVNKSDIHLSIVKVLLDSGADVNATAKMVLYLSGQSSSRVVTSLILAISKSSEGKVAAFLLQHPANPNIADETGETPLDYAIVYGETNIIEDLIGHHGDVNALDKHGDPPLAYISRHGEELKEKIKQMLIRAGANEDYQRRGAIFIAQKGTGSIGNKVFSKGMNTANRYTLFELIAKAYGGESGRFGTFGVNAPAVAFPDLAHVTVNRLKADGSKEEIAVNLTEILQSGDCSKNPGLEWGDIVLIPQLDHNVNDGWRGLSQSERDTLGKCLLRKVKVVVKGQTAQLALLPSIVQTYTYTAAGAGGIVGETWFQSGPYALSPALTGTLNGESALYTYNLDQVVHEANVLLISSDLSRVKVTRQGSKAGEPPQVMEISLETHPAHQVRGPAPIGFPAPGVITIAGVPGRPGQVGITTQDFSDFPLQDGDIVEIPERDQK